MRGALWFALCMCLLCVCAYADASDAAAAEKAVAQEPEQTTLRSLRQEKDAQTNDDKDQQDQLRQGGAATTTDDKQPIGGRLVEKSGARAIHRVYDPISGLYCELVGDCHPCPVSEKDEVYCRETSHRQELLCPRTPENNKVAVSDANTLLQDVRFKACIPEEKANPLLTVFLFELVMAGAFAGAFVLLRKEQQNHLSSFDLRKDPRQRGPLLGATGASKGAD
ncbi:hypothetical protein FI667_g6824, partial [Globisporangium splendens]